MNGKLCSEFILFGSPMREIVSATPPQRARGGESKYIYATPVRHWIGITTACEYPEKIFRCMTGPRLDGSVFIHAGVSWDYDKTEI